MTLGLHTLQSASGSRKRRKIVGRGNASGHGTYSTRGLKGQRARTGGRGGLKLLGMKHIIQSIPKKRGFRSKYQKYVYVNLVDLDRHFQDGEKVTSKELLKKGIIDTIKHGVKVLGTGPLSKKLTVSADAFSEKAMKIIEEKGGKAVIITRKKRVGPKVNKYVRKITADLEN